MVHSWRDWLCLGWDMSPILCGMPTFQNLSMLRYWYALSLSVNMEMRFCVQVMGTSELIQTKIHVDHMIDSLARYCSKLERLEFRWDNETLR